MKPIEDAVDWLAGFLWGWPIVALLVGGGLVLSVWSRGVPFRRMRHAVNVLRGKYDDPNDPGEITHFQALATALSSTIGMGNIAGVAVAISAGGPGAVFWMWVTALVGMGTKFFTCTLACMYRKTDEAGVLQGGPMYYIEVGLGKRYKPLAMFFSACGLVGCLSLLQANQLAEVLEPVYSLVGLDQRLGSTMLGEVEIDLSRALSGLLIAASVGFVILGGLHRLVQFSERLVPAMCLVYVGTSLVVLALRAGELPGLVVHIVEDAFTGRAVAGGAFWLVVSTGVRRAAFSNEAGIGTAPMAHGAAKTDEPVREGLVAMLGPLIDTLMVCTMTALVILSSGADLRAVGTDDDLEAVSLTSAAFASALGTTGTVIVTVSVILFSMTTMFGYSYYGRKCATYLGGPRWGQLYNYVYIASLAVSAVVSVNLALGVLDCAFALMALPNMIAALLLAPRVMEAADDYFARQGSGE